MRQKFALWKVYISGRKGFEKELGFVIAPSSILAWARQYGAVLAQDIIQRGGTIEELLCAARKLRKGNRND